MYPRLVNDHSDKASDSFQWSGNPESTFIHTPAVGFDKALDVSAEVSPPPGRQERGSRDIPRATNQVRVS